MIFRPFRLPEYVYALTGAAALVLFGFVSPIQARTAILKGANVYLFLIGMMLLSEAAREAGVFDWAAGHAAQAAKGSAVRLFALVYGVGALTTVFLSNDATVVVLTPAVYAAARKAQADPLPHLLACAFIANAASFVLPISNPANLVMYAERTPVLLDWIRAFAAPSAAAILATYAILRFLMRERLAAPVASPARTPPLTAHGRFICAGLAISGGVLLAASACGGDLGMPTLACGLLFPLAGAAIFRRSPLNVVKNVAWGAPPLVAGLFVLVEGFESADLARPLIAATQANAGEAAFGAGLLAGLLTNVMNNLPCGFLAASTAQAAHAPSLVMGGLLIGVDLGPNLSIAGSLAGMLWLMTLRREGVAFSALDFFKIGAAVMPPALLLSLAALVGL